MQVDNIEDIVSRYKKEKHIFEGFLNQVRDYFLLDPELNNDDLPIIHSIKSRLKDPEHLEKKILRKKSEGRDIKYENIYQEITDLAGVRILHLYMEQFNQIHKKLIERIESGDWQFAEPPKAYTWDPEVAKYLEGFGISCEKKESFYTSVHYLIKPNNSTSRVICELQVRTLFEEIWGEIDHSLNYPKPTGSVACREQLKVLARLVSTGTRLADSIFNSHKEYNEYAVTKEEISN